jgi:hypothetical protein
MDLNSETIFFSSLDHKCIQNCRKTSREKGSWNGNIDGRIILKWILNRLLTYSGWETRCAFCEYGNEFSGSIKTWVGGHAIA